MPCGRIYGAAPPRCADRPSSCPRETRTASPTWWARWDTCAPARRANIPRPCPRACPPRTVRGASANALQGIGDRGRQHRHPVLGPLAVADEDFAALEIHILHPQPHARHEAHAGAVQQRPHQANTPLMRSKAPDLLPGQHHRRNSKADSAWFCVEAETLPSTAGARLALNLVERIGREVGERLRASQPAVWRWRSREVKLVDGTTESMPDTSENQAEFPQSKSQKPGLGFPLARVVAIISLPCGAVLEWATGRLQGQAHRGDGAIVETGAPSASRRCIGLKVVPLGRVPFLFFSQTRLYCQVSPLDFFSAPATALMVSMMAFGRDEIRMNCPMPTSGNARAMRNRPCGEPTSLLIT